MKWRGGHSRFSAELLADVVEGHWPRESVEPSSLLGCVLPRLGLQFCLSPARCTSVVQRSPQRMERVPCGGRRFHTLGCHLHQPRIEKGHDVAQGRRSHTRVSRGYPVALGSRHPRVLVSVHYLQLDDDVWGLEVHLSGLKTPAWVLHTLPLGGGAPLERQGGTNRALAAPW